MAGKVVAQYYIILPYLCNKNILGANMSSLCADMHFFYFVHHQPYDQCPYSIV